MHSQYSEEDWALWSVQPAATTISDEVPFWTLILLTPASFYILQPIGKSLFLKN